MYNIVCNTNSTTNANEIKALTRVESERFGIDIRGLAWLSQVWYGYQRFGMVTYNRFGMVITCLTRLSQVWNGYHLFDMAITGLE